MLGSVGLSQAVETVSKPETEPTQKEEAVATPATKPVAVRNEPLSFGLEDIVKLVQSGAGTDVVLSYVENSPIVYAPTANDVMRMHEDGVPSEVIVAVLRHGGNLRGQEKQAPPASSATATVSAPPKGTVIATNFYYGPNISNIPADSSYYDSSYLYSSYPYYTYTYYPTWWYASYPSFWFGCLWPYYSYNCGYYYPRGSWCYAPRYGYGYYGSGGSWGYVQKNGAYPAGGYNGNRGGSPAYRGGSPAYRGANPGYPNGNRGGSPSYTGGFRGGGYTVRSPAPAMNPGARSAPSFRGGAPAAARGR